MRVSKGDFPAWVTGLVYSLGFDSVDEHGTPRKGDWQRLVELLRDAELTPWERDTTLQAIERMMGEKAREAAATWIQSP